MRYNSCMRGADNDDPLIRQLIAARQAAGYTQRAVSEALGLSHATVSHWEAGRSKPTLADLRRFAAFLGKEIVCVLGDSNPGPAD